MIRKSFIIIVVCALAAACSSGKSGKELLAINGKSITEGDLDFLGSINPRIKAQLGSPVGRKQIIDNIIEQELFYQAAVKKGLDHDPRVKEKADLYRRVIIAQSYVEKQLEDNARKFYDDHRSDFEKLRMSHILIKTKPAAPASPGPIANSMKSPASEGRSDADASAFAQKMKGRLDNKEDFATVAKEVSEDPITKATGGELGEVSRTEQRLLRKGYEPLIEKAFSMTVGEVSDPIKAEDGYHIIVVTRGVEVEPFDSAKQGIMFKQQGDIRNKLLTDLKKQAKITYADASLKPQEPPAAADTSAPTAPATLDDHGQHGRDHGSTDSSKAPTAPLPVPNAQAAPATTPPRTDKSSK